MPRIATRVEEDNVTEPPVPTDNEQAIATSSTGDNLSDINSTTRLLDKGLDKSNYFNDKKEVKEGDRDN